MNYQDIIFFDFEATGKNPHVAQPIQFASVIIHGRRLEIIEDSQFDCYIKPIFDEEECRKLGLQPLTDEVINITGITKKTLEKAPPLKQVWKLIQQYVNKYNPRRNKWGAPIKAGVNIDRYDNIIIDRICGGHFRKAKNELDKLLEGGILQVEGGIKLPEPYGFGPWEKERQEEALFYPRDSIDLQRLIWLWTENNPHVKSISMDAIRAWLGIDTKGSHNALKDVIDGAKILIRFMKLHRTFASKTKFEGAFK